MRKYQPDVIKKFMDTYESYGPVVQTLALLNEGWEPGQILKYYLEANTGVIVARPPAVIKIKKHAVTRRNYTTVKCPFCSFTSKPGAVGAHISYVHPDKKMTGEPIPKPQPVKISVKQHTEETKQKIKEKYWKRREAKLAAKSAIESLDSLLQSNTSTSNSS